MIFTFGATAQVSVGDSLRKHYFKLYEEALKYDDLGLAIISLNNVLIEMPPGIEKMKYKDTLSILYFNNRSYLASYLLAKEVFEADATNYAAIGRMGECQHANQEFEAAIEAYQKAAAGLNSPFYLYQIAICQYSLRNAKDCRANVEKVIADSASNSAYASFNMPNGSVQQIPLKAAALNLKAVLLMDEFKYKEALAYLNQSVEIFPNFTGARQNILTCEEKIKEAGAASKPKPKG